MTSVQRAGNDGYAATFGKAALGAAVPLGVLGALGSRPIGALPAAIWGVAGGVAAAGATKLLESQGMNQTAAGIVGGVGTAGVLLGAASLYGLTHGGIGLLPALGFVALPALGAITGGITAGLWK